MYYNESIVASASMLGTRADLPVYIPHLTDQKDSANNRRLLAESQFRFQVISKTLCPVTPALPLTTLGDATRWRTVPGSFTKTHAEQRPVLAAQYGAGNVPVHVTPIGARSIEHRWIKILSGLAREAQSLPRMAFPESLALIAQ